MTKKKTAYVIMEDYHLGGENILKWMTSELKTARFDTTRFKTIAEAREERAFEEKNLPDVFVIYDEPSRGGDGLHLAQMLAMRKGVGMVAFCTMDRTESIQYADCKGAKFIDIMKPYSQKFISFVKDSIETAKLVKLGIKQNENGRGRGTPKSKPKDSALPH